MFYDDTYTIMLNIQSVKTRVVLQIVILLLFRHIIDAFTTVLRFLTVTLQLCLQHAACEKGGSCINVCRIHKLPLSYILLIII